MQFNTLKYQTREQVAYVTLDRPERLNALDSVLVAELTAVARGIGAQSDLRGVLLTGSGRAFCSGADLMSDDMLSAPGRTLGENIGASLREHLNPMIEAWCGLPLPVVVAVNGIAAGAGVSLALVGDLVLAARSAVFVQLFAPKLGLMPDLGSSYHLPRLVGAARAKGLTLLGDPLPAEDAQRWGLIWACVADDALAQQAEALVRRLAQGPTQAFKRIKQALDRGAQTLPDQLALEALLQTELGDTQDFAEGIAAFRGKRAPRFSGF
jgi:2-(1,2-epoxy-1,2-dihydrophenyl)acetyl-CoA isomerase